MCVSGCVEMCEGCVRCARKVLGWCERRVKNVQKNAARGKVCKGMSPVLLLPAFRGGFVDTTPCSPSPCPFLPLDLPPPPPPVCTHSMRLEGGG